MKEGLLFSLLHHFPFESLFYAMRFNAMKVTLLRNDGLRPLFRLFVARTRFQP